MENQKVTYKMDLKIDNTQLEETKALIDKFIEAVKEANSLLDELTSKKVEIEITTTTRQLVHNADKC